MRFFLLKVIAITLLVEVVQNLYVRVRIDVERVNPREKGFLREAKHSKVQVLGLHNLSLKVIKVIFAVIEIDQVKDDKYQLRSLLKQSLHLVDVHRQEGKCLRYLG